MSGTVEGGRRAALTNKKRYGDTFYRSIGKLGGAQSGGGGFASPYKGKDGLTGKERSRIAGRIGGRNSRRKASQ